MEPDRDSTAPNPRAPLAPAPLVLGSASPRRRELLLGAGIRFEVIAADIPEPILSGEAPEQMVERLARAKAVAVASRLAHGSQRWVLGADTIVVLDGDVLGKPDDPEHAVSLLSRLTGREHRVLTGIALVDAAGTHAHSQVVASRVWMRRAEEAEIRRYVAGGEPLDKAGAYAVQGEGRRFVERIEGSESNVIGLPLDETLALLRSVGLA